MSINYQHVGRCICMAKEYKLSAERLDELKNELNYLKTVREREVADLIKEARSFGDLSENSEYDEAKNEQGKLYSRIAEIENILSNCVVITEEMQAKEQGLVRLGSPGARGADQQSRQPARPRGCL